jgi:hypothetical protein
MPAECLTAFATMGQDDIVCQRRRHCFQNIPSASIKPGKAPTRAAATEAPAKTLVKSPIALALGNHGEEVCPQRLRQDVRERGRRVLLPPRAARLPRGTKRFGLGPCRELPSSTLKLTYTHRLEMLQTTRADL